jgi:hypothetical protein
MSIHPISSFPSHPDTGVYKTLTIYDWRKKARQAARQSKAATLVSVNVTEPDQAETAEPKQSCSVLIEAQTTRITITGLVDAIVVRTILECLAR